MAGGAPGLLHVEADRIAVQRRAGDRADVEDGRASQRAAAGGGAEKSWRKRTFGGAVMYGRPLCCKGKSDLKRR
jgi:hypothetical protein